MHPHESYEPASPENLGEILEGIQEIDKEALESLKDYLARRRSEQHNSRGENTAAKPPGESGKQSGQKSWKS